MAFEVRFQWVLCLFLTLLHIYPGVSRTTKLFGADPAGGLWGVELDTDMGTSARLLSSAGYPQSLFNKQIATATYDPKSGQVLMETSGVPRNLYYGPLCERNTEAPRLLTQIDDFTIHDDRIGDCMACDASAFTLYNSKIYFLLTGEFIDNSGEVFTRVAQIRVFQACDECGSKKKSTEDYDFQDIITCSKIVVEVLRQTIDDDAQLKGGKHMKVVEDEGMLSFFFQTGNITMSDSGKGKASMALWHADETGDAHVLFESEIANQYGSWDLNSQGSIDYHEGMLCWTYPDTVFCGDLIGHTLRRGTRKLEVAQGVIAGVCTGKYCIFLHLL